MSLWSLWLLVYRPWGLGLVSYYVYVYMYIYICIYDNSVCICRHIGMFFFFLGGGLCVSVVSVATSLYRPWGLGLVSYYIYIYDSC